MSNLLDADVEALVNTVNTVGVMGKGLALQFKRRFPSNYEVYAGACRRGEVQVGRMLVVKTVRHTAPRFIINFPTKKHWRDPSRLEYVRAGLIALVSEVKTRGIRSIAIPPLGCGNGGLAWSEVRPLINRAVIITPTRRIILPPWYLTRSPPTRIHQSSSNQITCNRHGSTCRPSSPVPGAVTPAVACAVYREPTAGTDAKPAKFAE